MTTGSRRCSVLAAALFLLSLLAPPHLLPIHSLEPTDPKSSFNQTLPDCTNLKFPRIQKKTSWKGILCPMVKDETGFLSEWLAYHEMQGFDHVIFFDNNSTTPMDEVKPWVDSGFAEIVPDGWTKEPWLFRNEKKRFHDMMFYKFRSEAICKERAIAMGYDIFVSIDTDEYLLPINPGNTVMDEMADWFAKTTRGVMMVPKYNFNPSPHYLEPINLLTIEAYTNRMKNENQMNYYTNVASKVALQISFRDKPEYSNDTLEYLTHCCDFHGCFNTKFHKRCGTLFKNGERWRIEGKHRKWLPTMRMNHYARSLEKYMSKQRTWKTASHTGGYEISGFMERTFGFTYDDSAIVYGCQVREILRNRTREQDYIRPGDWYRNPEFGRVVQDPAKRGRSGAGFGKYIHPSEFNPYPAGEAYQRAHKSYDSSQANKEKP